MIRLSDSVNTLDKLPDMLTAMVGLWGVEELPNGDDVMVGNVIIGFRYNTNTVSGYTGHQDTWITTMAIIAYVDGTSENRSFTETLTLSKQATIIILIARSQ